MKKPKHRKNEEIDFWQSSSDLMTALLLILLLVILLLILYLIRVPEDDFDHFHNGTETEYMTTPTPSPVIVPIQNNNSNGGSTHPEQETETETETESEYPYEEEAKSAVYVWLVDAETDKTIKEEDVTFELYGSRRNRMTLNTYYPLKISYREFKTTEEGTFYLPEKIRRGKYMFRNITEATGYDLADDYDFEVDDIYDWPDPLIVKIPAFPSRNVLVIHMVDKETGEPVSGGTFTVKAVEDIVTLDGTLRYSKGDEVSTIECDENGVGISDELYLGKYSIVQKDIPQWYAGIKKSIKAETVKKTDEKPSPSILNSERTKIELDLSDQYSGDPIPDTRFEVTYGSESNIMTTDTEGKIVIDEVEKNTVYTFRQTGAVDKYHYSEEPVVVNVSSKGRIDGEEQAKINLTNYKIRVEVQVLNAVLNSAISDTSVALYNEEGQLLDSWATNGIPKEVHGLEPGTYTAILNDDKNVEYVINIYDTDKMQVVTITVKTMLSYLAIAGIAAGTVLVLLAAVFVIRRLLKKKKV